MGMDDKDLKKVVSYVAAHPGCSHSEIGLACPDVKDLSTLLTFASEGARQGTGYILLLKGGRYYLGPQSYLLNED